MVLPLQGRSHRFKSCSAHKVLCEYETYKSRTASSFEVLDSVVSKDGYRVYPDKLFCNSYIKNECTGKFEDKIFYIDDDHLSPDGEQLLSEEILKLF